MKDLGTTIYRFSVSWPRILPNCNGQVNQAGIDFYNSLIDELLRAGIQPILTMYHWDTPQACEDQYRSWSSDRIITDFTNYADILFENFGDRVKLWLTINEPAAYCGRGFGPVGDAWVWPPGHLGSMQAKYDCVGRVTLAHGAVVNLARTKYARYDMKFSMPLIIAYYIPVDTADIPGANELTQSQADWLWAPLVTGDYPSYLRTLNSADLEGRYLPTFTDEQKAAMRGTLDYLAINYYSAVYYNEVSRRPPPGSLFHPPNGVEWQYSYPPGLRDITRLLSTYYAEMGMRATGGKAEVMISECGYGSTSEAFETSIANRVNDVDRQQFFAGITAAMRDAIVIDQTPITSFVAWSLLDNLEYVFLFHRNVY
jgi:beta-glucosidase